MTQLGSVVAVIFSYPACLASGGGLSYATLLGATNRSGLTLWLQTPPYGTARIYYQQSMYSGYGAFPSGTNDMSIGWNCFFYEMGSAQDAPATTDHLFRNGVETTSYTAQGASASLAAVSGAWELGGGGFSSSLQIVGTIEHVLAWNRLLSATEVSTAWQALQTEMTGRGVVFNPPGSQTTDAVLDCAGDSQTAGTVAGATWCSTALLTLPANATWELNNNAENGTTCVAMESGIPAQEALDWSPNAPHSALMLFCGTNDIIVGGEPASAIWARELAICQLCRGLRRPAWTFPFRWEGMRRQQPCAQWKRAQPAANNIGLQLCRRSRCRCRSIPAHPGWRQTCRHCRCRLCHLPPCRSAR